MPKPPRPRVMTVRLTEQQRYLAARKKAARRESWQFILTQAVNDYITGDWEPMKNANLTPTQSQRAYKIWGEDGYDVEDGLDPTLAIEDDDDVVDLDELLKPDPWTVPDLRLHLEEQLERSIRPSTLYKLLGRHFPKSEGQVYYEWSGPEDPQVIEIMEMIEDGEMERIRDEMIERVTSHKTKHRPRQRKQKKKK